MGSGGKGGGDASKDLGKIAKEFFKETKDIRGELEDQFLEALTTGGVGARIPIIEKAQEASRMATSNSLQQLDTQLAQSGLAGTPFGNRIRADALMSGRRETAMIPTNIVGQLLQQVPGYVTGANQTVVSGLGNAASAEAAGANANANLLGALMSSFRFTKSFGS